MKWRALTLVLVFAVGAATGYFAAQKEVQLRAHSTLMTFGSAVEVQVNRLLQKAGARNPQSAEQTSAALSSRAAPAVPAVSAEDTAEYLRKHVHLSALDAKRENAGTAAIVSGLLINSGERTLSKADMTLYFMGQDDILHETKLPLLANSALNANSSKEFAWKIDAVPADWSGKIRGVITEIGF